MIDNIEQAWLKSLSLDPALLKIYAYVDWSEVASRAGVVSAAVLANLRMASPNGGRNSRSTCMIDGLARAICRTVSVAPRAAAAPSPSERQNARVRQA